MMPNMASVPIGILADRDDLPDAKLAIQKARHQEETAGLLAQIKRLEVTEADYVRIHIGYNADLRKALLESARRLEEIRSLEKRLQECEADNLRLTDIVEGDFEEQVEKMVAAATKEAAIVREKAVKSAYVRGHEAGRAEFLETFSPQQMALREQLREAKDELLMARAVPKLPRNVVQQLTRLRLAIGSLCVDNEVIPGAARLEGRDWELVDSIATELGKAPATPAPMEKEEDVDNVNDGLEID